MAVCWRGMQPEELAALTQVMAASGEQLDLSSVGRPVADKHSTGGVGDKTSLVVMPLVAACGVPVGKMSGRGLGFTGGTIDKLESFPGIRVDLSAAEFVRQLHDVGVVITGQSADLAPADGKLYALRDVTGTVPSLPLIASSIMSKKIAGGADAIVLDVKVGDGAFMKDLDQARLLAETMLELGTRAGREVVCVLTDMDQPLGTAVGNALEIREAVATLRGEGPPDFTELVLASCAHLLALSDLGVDAAAGRRRAEAAVASGEALAAYERWVVAQAGDPDEAALPRAPVVRGVPAPREGIVTRIGAVAIGTAALHLGAGRQTKDDAIDHAVGIRCLAKRGDAVDAGQPLAEVHARGESAADAAVAEVVAAYELAHEPADARPIVLETIG
jgi:pyrimidine-nucleoside phosphorylase